MTVTHISAPVNRPTADPPAATALTLPTAQGDGTVRNGTVCLLPDLIGITPWQRVLLWANGNVQRILSAYHNQPLRIHVLRNDQVLERAKWHLETHQPDANALLLDREVQLLIGDRSMCRAQSKVAISDASYERLFIEEGVGIGQLFHYSKVVPDFHLVRIGHHPDGSFWRLYTLSVPGVHFEIHEHFSADVFQLDTADERTGISAATPNSDTI
ncbi:hypothetical protein IWQ60_006750 [Tieghemiomyces parasiticus]|uniref:Chorismate lyase n=1 Tax=Tieghemiomyces parasiticus TaxID=78921 RepID=A0A9W8A2K6_9FUNG|nr:hypothetical protein IWQ60_006750 [Tieghemiomyces parasiticus]